MSAFLSYSQEMRPRIREELPGLKNSEVSVVLAQRWREASEAAKRPHQDRERADRQKYYEDLALWKASEEDRIKEEEAERKRQSARNTLDFLDLPGGLVWSEHSSVNGSGSSSRRSSRPSSEDGGNAADRDGSEISTASVSASDSGRGGSKRARTKGSFQAPSSSSSSFAVLNPPGKNERANRGTTSPSNSNASSTSGSRHNKSGTTASPSSSGVSASVGAGVGLSAPMVSAPGSSSRHAHSHRSARSSVSSGFSSGFSANGSATGGNISGNGSSGSGSGSEKGSSNRSSRTTPLLSAFNISLSQGPTAAAVAAATKAARKAASKAPHRKPKADGSPLHSDVASDDAQHDGDDQDGTDLAHSDGRSSPAGSDNGSNSGSEGATDSSSGSGGDGSSGSSSSGGGGSGLSDRVHRGLNAFLSFMDGSGDSHEDRAGEGKRSRRAKKKSSPLPSENKKSKREKKQDQEGAIKRHHKRLKVHGLGQADNYQEQQHIQQLQAPSPDNSEGAPPEFAGQQQDAPALATAPDGGYPFGNSTYGYGGVTRTLYACSSMYDSVGDIGGGGGGGRNQPLSFQQLPVMTAHHQQQQFPQQYQQQQPYHGSWELGQGNVQGQGVSMDGTCYPNNSSSSNNSKQTSSVSNRSIISSGGSSSGGSCSNGGSKVRWDASLTYQYPSSAPTVVAATAPVSYFVPASACVPLKPSRTTSSSSTSSFSSNTLPALSAKPSAATSGLRSKASAGGSRSNPR